LNKLDPTGAQAVTEYEETTEERDTGVYLAEKNGKCYFGITNDFARRAAQHGSKIGGKIAALIGGLTRSEAFALETFLILSFPGLSNAAYSTTVERALAEGPGLLNKIAPDVIDFIIEACT
jgi:hypothetical protein